MGGISRRWPVPVVAILLGIGATGAALYQWANDLHLATHTDAIRSQLLFHESEPYSPQKIAETERLLRGRRYLYDAWIEPTCYHAEQQTVDLRVRVRDVWSLNPGFNFSRAGGANHTGIELQDEHLLGRGELISVSWGRNVDRDTLLFIYDDPQVLGSWWRGRLAYSDNSDGRFGDLQLERPPRRLGAALDRWHALRPQHVQRNGRRSAGGSAAQ